MDKEILQKSLRRYTNTRSDVTSRVVLTEKVLPPLVHPKTSNLEPITWRQTRHNCNWEDFV